MTIYQFQTSQIADGAIGNAELTDASIQSGKLSVFKSTEQTGTGSSQNVAHGLGRIPALVLVYFSKVHQADDSWTEGTHDGTNCVVTVSANSKFKIVAF